MWSCLLQLRLPLLDMIFLCQEADKKIKIDHTKWFESRNNNSLSIVVLWVRNVLKRTELDSLNITSSKNWPISIKDQLYLHNCRLPQGFASTHLHSRLRGALWGNLQFLYSWTWSTMTPTGLNPGMLNLESNTLTSTTNHTNSASRTLWYAEVKLILDGFLAPNIY